MKELILLFFILVNKSLCTTFHGDVNKISDNKLDWWQKSVFYQIYPRSFKDSDNDGIGDIPGIIQKIGHIVDLGVDAIWLSPIYKSPMIDGGYDISDFRDIAPEYGTISDFKTLLKEVHDNGIKLILDFVPNHSSDLHEWFNKSVNKEAGYEDYYIWVDAKYNENGERVPPNNWLSVFGNSAWTWNEQRQQYYFHQFTRQQPDLNYRSEIVRNEMKAVLKYWLDMGVDGFRVDAVPHVYENSLLLDEPIDPDSGVDDPNNWNYLKHIYTKDQPETFELVYDWRQFMDNYTKTEGGDTRIFMTECATSLENVIRYYGNENGTIQGAHFSFNFYFLGINENSRASDIVEVINEWTNNLPSVYTYNWLTGNHDNHRVASRVGTKNIDGYNMILMFLPGITINYMAEEIGQEDGEVTCEQGQDPSAIGNCTTFNQTSRDFERTPFQWDNSVNGGFNDGAATWLPVSQKYKETNLAKQVEENRSHYHIYEELIKIKQDLLSLDILNVDESDPDVLQISRAALNKASEYLLVFNMGTENKNIPVSGSYVVLSSSVNADYLPGDQINNQTIKLKSGDSLVYKKN